MEIDNPIFQHLESFRKGRFFDIPMEKFETFDWGKSKIF